MKAGWNPLLEQAVRTAPRAARVIVEAQVVARNADNTEQADIRHKLADWQQLDSLPGNVDLLPDGGVRLRPTANNGPINTAITAEARMIGDAGATQPFINPLSNGDSNTRLAAWV